MLVVVLGHSAVPHARHGGGVGVTVFFALSGYLITGILLREVRRTGTVRFGGFYAKRALRLAPALLLLLALLPVLIPYSPGWGSHYWRNAFAAAGYFANWAQVGGWNLMLLNHTWSLSVEEHFYLLWPALLLLGCRRLSPRRFAVVVSLGAVVFLAWRVGYYQAGASSARIYYGTDTNAGALMSGAAVAAWHQAGVRPRLPGWLPSLAVLGILCAVAMPGRVTSLGAIASQLPALVAVGCAALIVAASGQPVRGLTWRPLRYLGAVSYGWYLWHVPLVSLTLYRWQAVPIPWRGLLASLVALGIASASYHLFEVRFLALKRHFPSATREDVPEGENAGTAEGAMAQHRITST